MFEDGVVIRCTLVDEEKPSSTLFIAPCTLFAMIFPSCTIGGVNYGFVSSFFPVGEIVNFALRTEFRA